MSLLPTPAARKARNTPATEEITRHLPARTQPEASTG